MLDRNSKSRCKALKKDGTPCQAAPMAGGLCFLHANPNKAVERGRIGGKRHSRISSRTAELLLKVESMSELRLTVSQLINRVMSGELPPRVGAAVATLLNLQLRTLEIAEVEPRIAKVEKRLVELEEKKAHTETLEPSGPRSLQ